MAWTRTDAFNLMSGKYTLHHKGPHSAGRIEAAGDFDSLPEAQVEAARWRTWAQVAKREEWEVWVVQYGRFVEVDEEKGELRRLR